MNVSMTIGDVEIISPSDSREAWDLVLLIKSLLAWLKTQSPSAKAHIETAQRRLKLPPGDNIAATLAQYVLALDGPDGTGIFSDDSMDAPRALASRAKRILGMGNPPAFMREQVLYAAGLKTGPRPSDLAMLKGGGQEVVSLDAIVRGKDGKSKGAVGELASVDFTVTIDLDLTQLDMEKLVSQLRSGSPNDKKLAHAISETVKSGKLAPKGADKHYQRIRRNEKKLRDMAKLLRASKQRALPLTGGAMTLTVLGEHLLATTSNRPVQHSGITSDAGRVYKPANMELDESRPTKQQVSKAKAAKKKPPHK